MRRVFLTGGSGFVGTAVMAALLERGWAVNALVKHVKLNVAYEHLTPIQGDLFDGDSLDRGMADCQACIHLVGIIAEHRWSGVTFDRMHIEATRMVLGAEKRAGIERHLHMSALGARPNAPSEYHRTKFAGEQLVRGSGIPATIIRPSMIHGPGGAFMKMEAKWARGKAMPFLFMPYFGGGVLGLDGAGLLQPIFVNDVARVFAEALDRPETIGQTFEIAGPDRVTWPQLHHDVSRAVTGKSKPAVPVPAWYAKAMTHVVPANLLPFNRAQVVMSQEDNITDIDPFVRAFGFSPRPWVESVNSYAGDL